MQSSKHQNKIMRKLKFVKVHFLRNPTIGYLSMCNLDKNAMGQLLNMFKFLNFQCAKYLIDCWDNGLYKWNELFVDHTANCHRMLIHFVCSYGNEQAILHILNIYAEKGLDVECRDARERLPIRYLCCCDSFVTFNRIIDIYVERNLDLECVMSDGRTLLHLLCSNGPEQSIKRMVLLYIERNYDLERKTLGHNNALKFICRFKNMGTIKFIIDVYHQQKLSLNDANGPSLETFLNANFNLNGNRVIHMYLNSLEMEVFV